MTLGAIKPEPEHRIPLAYPAETILTALEVAEWIGISEKTVLAMPLPRLRLGGKLVRYSAGQVLAYLEGRSAA